EAAAWLKPNRTAKAVLPQRHRGTENGHRRSTIKTKRRLPHAKARRREGTATSLLTAENAKSAKITAHGNVNTVTRIARIAANSDSAFQPMPFLECSALNVEC